ncbi:SDR family NAD(P)-dependent oxidoreductase [Caballeronia sp. LZ001]|uniref:SDR family NAD(P)-dependent oxidoreductase n=1 Tax=Caballeronia sp. LZ001 TaxID=3038553 RepID=UPI0028557901|nr:SDR family NAD(P)-dependent oxidoreductase [Caballeronia sp. LZ001]MDR5804862.1 SDR family NAD(P)-dependent oxidoreductase [Caballeronia sp. LZ001]
MTESISKRGTLAGKTAVVTGAAGTIGCATVIKFLSEGARVFAVDREQADWSRLKLLRGRQAADLICYVADVVDEAGVAQYVQEAQAALGRIDVFFNNAGIEGEVRALHTYSLSEFRRVLDVNLIGCFLGLKSILPVMYRQSSGAVINASSTAGLVGGAGMVAYCASKHGVVGLTRVAALEAASYGVRVNCINPGPIEGRMMLSILEQRSQDPGAELRRIEARIPAGRFGRPAEVAEMVTFLASDVAAFCNGGCYTIDGGLTAA